MATRGRSIRTIHVGAAAALALILAACEQDPVGVGGEAEVVTALEQATVAEWGHLTTEEQVEAQVQEAAAASGDEDARWAVTWSAVLASEAEVARGAGRGPLGVGMAADGRLLVAGGAVAMFGEGYARDRVRGVEGAMARIEAVAAGRLPAERREALVRARAALQAALAAQSGDPEAALAGAMEASAHLKELAPEHAATEAVRLAAEFLAKARTAADGDSRYDDALARAEGHLETARDHLEAEAWGRAIASSRHSIVLSRRVIAAVRWSGGDRPGPTSEQAAERAIDMATDLYARAEARVGASGTPEQLEALARARGRLDAAGEAFEAGEFGVAIREAVKSAHISRRLIAADIVAGITASIAARAIEAALSLHARAEAKVGTGGTQAQLDALARAEALIGEAQGAYDAGEYVKAMRLAAEAGALCRRLIYAAA